MKHKQQGSIIFKLLMLGLIAGGLAYYKDANGESYLQKGINTVKYYTVDRNAAAVDSAKGAKELMQAQQDKINNALNEQ
jgi:bacillopeptidase F (M6 metalloprotease family)